MYTLVSRANTSKEPIDTLRGLACIFLVMFHAVGSTPNLGLEVSSGGVRDFNDFLSYFRMPLFTFLSGVVYSLRPFNGGFLPFVKGKFRRLLVPMLVVGTVFAVIQSRLDTGSFFSGLDYIHIYPVAHFWFVESIFLVFLLVALLEYLGVLAGKYKFSIVIVVAIFAYVYAPRPGIFSIAGAVYLLPFFLLGVFMGRFLSDVKFDRRVIFLLILLLFLCVLAYIGLIGRPSARQGLFSLFVGAFACALLYFFRPKNVLLAKIGGYSYSIYLYHVFFMSPTRTVLQYFLGGDGDYLLVYIFLITLSGILGAVIFEVVVKRYISWASPFMLGVKRAA